MFFLHYSSQTSCQVKQLSVFRLLNEILNLNHDFSISKVQSFFIEKMNVCPGLRCCFQMTNSVLNMILLLLFTLIHLLNQDRRHWDRKYISCVDWHRCNYKIMNKLSNKNLLKAQTKWHKTTQIHNETHAAVVQTLERNELNRKVLPLQQKGGCFSDDASALHLLCVSVKTDSCRVFCLRLDCVTWLNPQGGIVFNPEICEHVV